MTPETVTSAQWAEPGEPEPRLTVSELTSLMRAAADLERAQRPIVLNGPQTAAAPHPGIDIPAPPPPSAPAATVATDGRGERNPWPIVFMASACAGIGSCLVTAVTDSLIPLTVTLVAFAVWGVATYQVVFKEQ